MKELDEKELIKMLMTAVQNSIEFFVINKDKEFIAKIPKLQQAYKQIEEMIKLFHSPLGHMTKYNPKEEWIRIK